VKREPWVLAFALVLPSIMAWVYFVAASPAGTTVDEPSPFVRGFYILGKVVQIGLPIAWVWFTSRGELRLTRPTSRGIGRGVVFGLAVGAFAFFLYSYLRSSTAVFDGVPDRIREKLNEFGVAAPLKYTALAGFLSIINSAMEEYYWRWFMFGRLKKHIALSNAITISSLGFMAHHVIVLSVYFPGHFWSAVVPFSLAIAFGGAVWAWLYHRSGSLLGPWFSHFIVDVAVMTIGYDLAFRQ
jgi:membrane protease YdiL (CAAX protease family)